GGASERQRPHDLLGRRVDDVRNPAVGGIAPLAANPQLVDVGGSHRSNTTRPARSVMSTFADGSVSGEIASGFAVSTARSANLPASMLPRLSASPVATAPPI